MVTKQEIIDKIQNIKDVSILDDLMELLDLELDLASEIKLNEGQKTAIKEGLEELENGKLLSNDDANRITSEWLKKR